MAAGELLQTLTYISQATTMQKTLWFKALQRKNKFIISKNSFK